MKRFFCIMLLVILLGAIPGCSGRIVAIDPSPSSAPSPHGSANNSTGSDTAVKTGLSVIANAANSSSAQQNKNGTAKTRIDLVAVTVDDSGVIRSCEIDSVETVIDFDSAGNLLTDPSDTIYSKNELGEDYGMHEASPIGREWDEQAETMAEYAVGKTVEELFGIAVDDRGAPVGTDLSSSVTISVSGFLNGIKEAAESAVHLGAEAGDELTLVSMTDISESISAQNESDGIAQTSSTIAAVSFDDERITSCIFDAVQASIRFDSGGLLTEVPDSLPTKNDLGRDYGMHTASTIDKDWNEQAAAFARYAIGKTADDIAKISVNEKGSPTDPDLSSSVTLSVADFRMLLAKADEAE